MPGLASTVGERPPTNPAIRVCFPTEADGFFFCGGNKCAKLINSNFSSAVNRATPSTGKESGLQFSTV